MIILTDKVNFIFQWGKIIQTYFTEERDVWNTSSLFNFTNKEKLVFHKLDWNYNPSSCSDSDSPELEKRTIK